jgi:two-component system cell cycle response regulator DivK
MSSGGYLMTQIDNNDMTIMVVDDDDDVRLLIMRILQVEGYRQIGAASGVEAHQLALEDTPDLILMDIGMPRMDGLTALWKMREYPELAHVPVVIISAYDSYDLRGEAASAGCQGYLTKPIDPADLRAMVKRVLRS